MLISVVIPTRHRNDLLAACLDRLAPGVQSLPPCHYEVIVSDDGSTSTAESMVRERFAWAQWVSGPRRGPAANRNHGAKRAVGEWIAFTDDDCLPSAHWLAAFSNAITLDPGQLVLEGKTTCEGGLPSPRYHAPVNLSGGYLWSCNFAIRRVLFEEIRFDESFPRPHMEDVYFRERLRALGKPFSFVPDAIVDHPPRRLPAAAAMAAIHECDVIFHYKMGRPCPGLLEHLTYTAKFRVRELFRHRWSLDTLRFAVATVGEFIVVAMRYRGWVRLHAGLATQPVVRQPAISVGHTTIGD